MSMLDKSLQKSNKMFPLNFVIVATVRDYQTTLTWAKPDEYKFNEIIWCINISIYSKMAPLYMQFKDQNKSLKKFKISVKFTKVILVYFCKVGDTWTIIVIIDLSEELSRCEVQFTDACLYPMKFTFYIFCCIYIYVKVFLGTEDL